MVNILYFFPSKSWLDGAKYQSGLEKSQKNAALVYLFENPIFLPPNTHGTQLSKPICVRRPASNQCLPTFFCPADKWGRLHSLQKCGCTYYGTYDQFGKFFFCFIAMQIESHLFFSIRMPLTSGKSTLILSSAISRVIITNFPTFIGKSFEFLCF